MVSLSNYCIWYLFFYIYFHEVEHSLCRKFMHICKIWDNDLTYNPTQKSLGQYCNIHIFLSFLGSLLKQCILFENLLQYSLPHTLYKVETRKKIWIHVSNIVCGVRGGVEPVWIERPRITKVSQDFCPWL